MSRWTPNDLITVIMPIAEPKPRGTVLDERVDGRRVPEAEHFFRCKACGGWIDARDLVSVQDHEGALAAPGARSRCS
jgi:hypothetical protein